MGPDERATSVAERCALHPNRQAVGVCASCGNALCVACAVPVRGSVLGVECVERVLGAPPQPPVRPTRSAAARAAGAGLGLAALASAFPWTRTGVGDGLLGGWDSVPSWSFAASAISVAALLVWVVAGPRGRRTAIAAAAVGGLLAIGGAAMAAIHPPFLTRPWLGPFVAIGGGLLAAIAAAVDIRRAPAVR
jgi:hypothetical protein